MNGAEASVAAETASVPKPDLGALLSTFRSFGLAVAALCVVFAWPLIQLIRLGLANDLYSHVGLIPLASLYLIWINRDTLPGRAGPDRKVALGAGCLGLALAAAYLVIELVGGGIPLEDRLALAIGGLVLLLIAAAAWFLGRPILRRIAFPLGALIFMLPMPVAVMTAVEAALQHGSAVTAHWFFQLSGMPTFRDSTLFMLPGFSMEVAPECSGIRSSLALFITSTFAGYLFLHSLWKRVVLSLAVIPLALLRNGFRVWVIGELCVNVSPDMIDSFIHHQGGPIFFALSLIPFSALLWLLARSERKRTETADSKPAFNHG